MELAQLEGMGIFSTTPSMRCLSWMAQSLNWKMRKSQRWRSSFLHLSLQEWRVLLTPWYFRRTDVCRWRMSDHKNSVYVQTVYFPRRTGWGVPYKTSMEKTQFKNCWWRNEQIVWSANGLEVCWTCWRCWREVNVVQKGFVQITILVE